MANIHGRNTSFIVAGFDLSTYLNRASADLQRMLHDVTTFQAAAIQRIAGLFPDGKMSAGGFWDGTATTGPDARGDAMMDGGQVGAMMGMNKTVVGTGNRCIFGKGRQVAYKIKTPVGNVVEFDFEFDADAGIWPGYYLHSSETAQTAGGTGANVDFGATAGALTGYEAQLQVTEIVSGVPALVVNIQRGDGASFTTVASFASTSVRGWEHLSGTTGVTGNFWRITWTQAGSTSVKFAVAVTFRSAT
jgi:hypothetical protein